MTQTPSRTAKVKQFVRSQVLNPLEKIADPDAIASQVLGTPLPKRTSEVSEYLKSLGGPVPVSPEGQADADRQEAAKISQKLKTPPHQFFERAMDPRQMIVSHLRPPKAPPPKRVYDQIWDERLQQEKQVQSAKTAQPLEEPSTAKTRGDLFGRKKRRRAEHHIEAKVQVKSG